MIQFKVGDRVVFVGPEYVHADGPTIGEQGVVTAVGGTASWPGEAPELLVTVRFSLDRRDTVLEERRLKLEGGKPSERSEMI